MGPEKLDNAVYYIRSLLRPRRHGALQARRARPFTWATNLAAQAPGASSRARGGTPPAAQYADSLIDPGNEQTFQKHWIGQVPMEAELTDAATRRTPGVASYEHGTDRAGRPRELVLQRRPARQPRPLPHRLRRRRRRQGRLRDLLADHRRSRPSARATTGASGADQQQRYTDANAETMFSEPATGGTPGRAARRDAGDLPVGAQRRSRPGHPAEHRPLLDLPLDGHAGVGQLRHRLAGGPPAARRAPVPERRRGAGRAAGAAGPAQRGGHEHPARRRRRWTSSPSHAGATLHHQGRTRRTRRCSELVDRPHAAARVAGRARSRSTATASSTTTRRGPTAGSRSRSPRARARSTR